MAKSANSKTVPLKSPPDRLLYPISEVGTLLGISRSGVYNLLSGGQLKKTILGGRSLVKLSEIERFVKSLPTVE